MVNLEKTRNCADCQFYNDGFCDKLGGMSEFMHGTPGCKEAHYHGTNSMECWDAMLMAYGPDRLVSFCIMNAFKYIWRMDSKDTPEANFQKALTYQAKAIELMDDFIDSIDRDMYCVMDRELDSLDYILNKMPKGGEKKHGCCAD